MSCLTRIGCLLAASTPLALSASHTFFIGDGEPCEQFQRIVNRSECERAAMELGEVYTTFIADNYPPGCHYSPAGTFHPAGEDGVLWNADFSGSWRDIGSLKAVCENTSVDVPPDFSAHPEQQCDQAYIIESSSECQKAADYLRVRYDTLTADNRPKGCYAEEDTRFYGTGRYSVVYWNFEMFPSDGRVGFTLAAVCEGGQPTRAPTAAPTTAPPTAAPTPAPTVPTAAPTAEPAADSSFASALFPTRWWLGVWGLLWGAQTS